MKKRIRQYLHKIFCRHDFYMDKQIRICKCIKCGYCVWFLNGHIANLYPTQFDDLSDVEKQLKSKESFQ